MFAPDKLLHEVEKHKEEILRKSKLTSVEFDLFLSIISSRIEFVSYHEFKNYCGEAERFSPDLNDAEYFALALNLGCAFWSNDKKLKQQNHVKVYSTDDLIKITKNK